MKRRDFIKLSLASGATFFLDLNAYPAKLVSTLGKNEYDAIVLGAGLGGLAFGAAMVRKGYKPLILERRDRPGGYASCFYKDGFTFDFSLRATTAREREGIINLIPNFPEIKEVEYVRYPNFYRAQFPNGVVSVSSGSINQCIDHLVSQFPNEEKGIKKLFNEMENNINKYAKYSWQEMIDMFLMDKKLKFALSVIWTYVGIPPSKISAVLYTGLFLHYIKGGTYYAKGGSQAVSNGFMNYIRSNGGKLLLNEEVNKLRVENNRVTIVQTKSGKEFSGKVVVSNINPITVFSQMIPNNYNAYLDKLFSIRLGASVFQVFLGTDRDIISESGINDFQIFHIPGYDIRKNSENALAGKFEKASFLISLYDNIYRGYSPEGKNTISLLLVQDFATWENLPPQEIETKKQTYKNQLVKIAEQCGLKGLSKHIEVEKVFTPLDCVKLANSYKGAIYGWKGNRGNSRLSQTTPIENLFLAGTWTQPGPGEIGVMISGLECFKKAMTLLTTK